MSTEAAALRAAFERRLLGERPEATRRPRLSAEELSRLLDAARTHPPTACSITLYMETRLSARELCALRAADVGPGTLRVGPRTIELTPMAMEAVRWLLAHRKPGGTLVGVTTGSFWMRVNRAATRAGLGSTVGRPILLDRPTSGLPEIPGRPAEGTGADLRLVEPTPTPPDPRAAVDALERGGER